MIKGRERLGVRERERENVMIKKSGGKEIKENEI